MNHAQMKLARTIDWLFLEERFGAVYEDKPGRPPLPTRLLAGLSILNTYDLSNEVFCGRWLENPYYRVPQNAGGDISGTVLKMGVWAPGAGLQGQASNHLMLLRSKGAVVGDEAKGGD